MGGVAVAALPESAPPPLPPPPPGLALAQALALEEAEEAAVAAVAALASLSLSISETRVCSCPTYQQVNEEQRWGGSFRAVAEKGKGTKGCMQATPQVLVCPI